MLRHTGRLCAHFVAGFIIGLAGCAARGFGVQISQNRLSIMELVAATLAAYPCVANGLSHPRMLRNGGICRCTCCVHFLCFVRPCT